MEVSGKLNTLVTIIWGMNPLYPLHSRLGEPHRAGMEGMAKRKYPNPCHESNHGHPGRNLVILM